MRVRVCLCLGKSFGTRACAAAHWYNFTHNLDTKQRLAEVVQVHVVLNILNLHVKKPMR